MTSRGGRPFLCFLAVLLLASLPLFAGDEFLDALEKELNNLDNALMKLESLSEGQRSELQNLSVQVNLLQTQLKDSQNQVAILKTQSQMLESQWEGLKNSLKESDRELTGLKVKNWILVGGISITLVLSLVAVIFVSAK